MAREERKKEDLFIKEKRRSKNFFITSSAKMDNDKGVSKTAISSSVFTKMSQSFADGEYLLDDAIREPNAAIIYMLQEMQQDIDDIYNEVSASSFQASFFPFARVDTGSFGVITSSLIPDKDSKYDLGSSGKEWNDLFIDGTANIDSLAMGTTVTSIKDEDNMSSNSDTALATQQSIKKYVDDNAGGGTIDSTLKNGSTNAVQNDAIYDEFQKKLSLTGGTMTGVALPRVTTITSAPNKGVVDMRFSTVIKFNVKLGATISRMTAAGDGQEVTIMNQGQGAATIAHASKPTPDGFFIYGGKNLSIAAGQVYKFIYSNTGITGTWLLVQ